MKRIHIFALESDLHLILRQIEARELVTYTSTEPMPTPELQQWAHGMEIDDIGIAAGEQTALCQEFLITNFGTPVTATRVEQFDGKIRFHVDQELNPDSIVFTPAGEWKRQMIIAGLFATLSSSSQAQGLMRLVSAAIKKHFTRVKGYWVGPRALLRLRNGFRLTMAEQSPPIYNLRESD
jgi:hypothetical protein